METQTVFKRILNKNNAATAGVFLGSFGVMVTSAYTADHIKRSSCDMKQDQRLTNAYNWATGTALISGTAAIFSVGSLIYMIMKK
jgi:hypothetical protein